MNFKHWNIDKSEDGIVWAFLDKKDSNTNTLSEEVMIELNELIDDVAPKSDIAGLVFASSKSSGFIAGADIEAIKSLDTKEKTVEEVTKGQEIFSKIESLKFPTVAMISGFCLGGGLELSLSCRYRVAEDDSKTKLGLPEVKLGVLPGWGGSVRLPKLIGAPNALNLMLNGHAIRGKVAAKMGLVDYAVPKRHLKNAAIKLIKNKPSAKSNWKKSLTNSSIGRMVLASLVKSKVRKKVKSSHYPAPYMMIDLWQKHGVEGQGPYTKAAKGFAELLLTPTSKNLLRVFSLQEQLKSLGKKTDFKAKRVHVIGAGVMGGDIAAWCAFNGLDVTLQDREPKFIAPAIKRAYKLFRKKLKQPRAVQEAMDRLIPDPKGLGVANADVIIEAVFENLEVKREIFKSIEANAKPDAIIATNTSSLVIESVNEVLKQPERLVGIHFFNPVALMPLVEIVKSEQVSEDVVNKASAFVQQISRLPLPVKSAPCFLVNRILAPYLLEAVMLIDDGVPPYIIDKVAEDFGMPVGPVELLDRVGLDVGMAVADTYTQHFNHVVIPDYLKQKVARGELGAKSGKGFYTYKAGKAVKEQTDNTQVDRKVIESRLVMRMLNESMACLREGIVDNADLLDAGMIFGTGFAPFRGGPMKYIDTEGGDKLLNQLANLKSEFGDRFDADKGWSGDMQTLVAT